jgi:hypothetical protein
METNMNLTKQTLAVQIRNVPMGVWKRFKAKAQLSGITHVELFKRMVDELKLDGEEKS